MAEPSPLGPFLTEQEVAALHDVIVAALQLRGGTIPFFTLFVWEPDGTKHIGTAKKEHVARQLREVADRWLIETLEPASTARN